MPAPACHQPIDPMTLAGRSMAVTQPVDCERCLARDPNPFTPLTVVDGGQLKLELDPSDTT